MLAGVPGRVSRGMEKTTAISISTQLYMGKYDAVYDFVREVGGRRSRDEKPGHVAVSCAGCIFVGKPLFVGDAYKTSPHLYAPSSFLLPYNDNRTGRDKRYDGSQHSTR